MNSKKNNLKNKKIIIPLKFKNLKMTLYPLNIKMIFFKNKSKKQKIYINNLQLKIKVLIIYIE